MCLLCLTLFTPDHRQVSPPAGDRWMQRWYDDPQVAPKSRVWQRLIYNYIEVSGVWPWFWFDRDFFDSSTWNFQIFKANTIAALPECVPQWWPDAAKSINCMCSTRTRRRATACFFSFCRFFSRFPDFFSPVFRLFVSFCRLISILSTYFRFFDFFFVLPTLESIKSRLI